MSDSQDTWLRAATALNLLAVDPVGLGGLWLRARSGPVRDRLIEGLSALPLPLRKIHPTIANEQLFGGVDVSATLAAGKVVETKGLIGQPSALILTMAERAEANLAGKLAIALDDNTCHNLILLDEGDGDEEQAPPALRDRLALHLDATDIAWQDTTDPTLPQADIDAARARLETIQADDTVSKYLTIFAKDLGIDSLRAPLLAVRTARVHCALFGDGEIDEDDLRAAVQLVYAQRATRMPEPEPESQDDTPPPPPDTNEGDQGDESETPDDFQIPEEVLMEAVKATLPADLLAHLAKQESKAKTPAGAGSGDKKKGNRRGRPLPSRPGQIDGTSKVDLVATLRAAAPWQPIRRKCSPRGTNLHIRAEDIRLKRFEEKSDRLLIFAVDASGSAAFSRLNEAKGAIELLLAEAYARRDHVALVAFRGDSAEILLPPTRSLVQTKRRLAALPGGGGTPLAAGLKSALDLALQARKRGMTPTVAILTDGRANIALDGTANRATAGEDADKMAKSLRSNAVECLVIDMSNRPQQALKQLSETLLAPYVPLPRADAKRLSKAVSTVLSD
ncbi:magnesium chelatase subunit D [Cognatishimia sp. MH4019]|uniref:magnesium chelatase subunit D n=1 Tax=Cognatishimia sp. MH4019 TaxID=2854030 RepID=UPI001CD39E93|nr:magnesium chelatase subunit D [Cognatishimia sp. MH4019]